MRKPTRLIVVSVVLAIVGCAKQPVRLVPSTQVAAVPTTQPLPAKAFLTLEQIQPAPVLAQPRPIAPGRKPSLDALQLFAQARKAIFDNQRFTAINLLEKAIKLDPDSFELRNLLGESYLDGQSFNDQSIAAFEAASEIEPNHLQVHSRLGRQYLAKGQVDHAIEHLRLAQLTEDFESDEDGAGVAEFFLARALQQQGYDRAALDEYQSLQQRLAGATLSMKKNPELAYLISRPEVLYVQTGELLAKLGRPAEALEAYEKAARRDPGNFDLQARVVRAKLSGGQSDSAAKMASDLVNQFRASSDSLGLLREVYKTQGRETAAADELSKLYQANPIDRSMLFAAVEMLRSTGRQAEGEKLLEQAALADGDFTVLRKLVELYLLHDDVQASARVLIESMSRRPEQVRQLDDLWGELLRPSRRNRLRVPTLQKLEVSPAAQPAKLYWLGQVGRIWNREALSRSSIEQAVKFMPVFPPAFRAQLGRIWTDPELGEAQKITESEQLAVRAATGGATALAAELRGLTLMNLKQPVRAQDELAQAVRLDPASPDARLAYAQTLRINGDDAKFEQMLWKLVSDRPTFEDAYQSLIGHYFDREKPAAALRALQTWLSNDPDSVAARLRQALVFIQSGRPEPGELLLIKLFDEHPDNDAVLNLLGAFYTQSNRLNDWVAKLEDQRIKQPENRAVVQRLVGVYAVQKRFAEAARVLDTTRAAVANDPDLLYSLAGLYGLIDQKKVTEEVLAGVVKLDPTHAPACNDLGYGWADEGRNLDDAEQLIRQAVDAEPDNESFIDSLGWVLYKRGKFIEAENWLQKAVKAAMAPDPVVVDHLGDVLYRLDRKDEAIKQWERSKVRLDEVRRNGEDVREDLRQLRLSLDQKLNNAKAGQPLKVAPIVANGK